MSAAPVSSLSTTVHQQRKSLLESAVGKISGFRELIDLAYFNIDETGPAFESLKKLDAELQKVIDPNELWSLQRQRNIRTTYAEIKKVVDAFVAEHGEKCGLEALDDLE